MPALVVGTSGQSPCLDVVSYAQCELVRSIERRRLVRRLGIVDQATHDRISRILATLLSL